MNNVIASPIVGPAASGTLGGTHVFKNNIFYVHTIAFVATTNPAMDSDYNCFFATDTADHVPGIGWSNSLAEWEMATTRDSHSLAVDPQFVAMDLAADPSTWDLHLQATSPIIDKGVDVGAGYLGAKPDIGAFEKQ